MKTPDSSLRARVSAREAIQNRTSSRLKRLHQRTFARPAMSASTLMRLHIQKPFQQRIPVHLLVGQCHRQHLAAKNIG